MGFWGKLADAAGEKTGKAIGNKLFGEYAEDTRIGVRGIDTRNNRGGDDDISTKLQLQKQTIELEADIREKERSQKMLDDLLLLEFDGEQIATNIKILTKLSSMIDVWIKDKRMTSIYDVAMSKFDTGLLISQTIDAENSMVLIMAKKKEKWNDYLERQKEIDMIEESKKAEQEKIEKKKAVIGLIVLLVLLLCLILILILVL